MSSKAYIVRIVESSPKPYLPDLEIGCRREKRPFLTKTMNILIGSGVGFVAGASILFTLKFAGADFGGLESSFIIGLPSALGLLASLAIF